MRDLITRPKKPIAGIPSSFITGSEVVPRLPLGRIPFINPAPVTPLKIIRLPIAIRLPPGGITTINPGGVPPPGGIISPGTSPGESPSPGFATSAESPTPTTSGNNTNIDIGIVAVIGALFLGAVLYVAVKHRKEIGHAAESGVRLGMMAGAL